ncbi:UNVERIFIED_CONTAM: protein indeterminate-domain 11 [Sesamum latifolium]|uniref:Protein indeterminate-domain 11 n=1 Tax=Sesamum latifolium TaxID=2727402 RepID=A0AAW2UD94_9LAMI
MSNLTSASGEASVSSSNINDNNGGNNMYPPQYFPPLNQPQPQSQPVKKKRNQPGHPDPDAEVIALSPRTLLATNRFVCEICNKGFQRDQNLQLHRRGHNLPWKLKQRSSKEVRKKVYVCPETSCVHHDPSRALGDLTGIKKHFCRKHGEESGNATNAQRSMLFNLIGKRIPRLVAPGSIDVTVEPFSQGGIVSSLTGLSVML